MVMAGENTNMVRELKPAQEASSAVPTTFHQILRRFPRRAFDDLLDKIDAEAAATAAATPASSTTTRDDCEAASASSTQAHRHPEDASTNSTKAGDDPEEAITTPAVAGISSLPSRVPTVKLPPSFFVKLSRQMLADDPFGESTETDDDATGTENTEEAEPLTFVQLLAELRQYQKDLKDLAQAISTEAPTAPEASERKGDIPEIAPASFYQPLGSSLALAVESDNGTA
ncbi:hypothetical protein QBC34DRAFT_411433, partial [Podospora aff. communis PSN243]